MSIYRERGYETGYRTGRSIGMAYLESPELKQGDRTELKAGSDFIKIMSSGGVASPTDPFDAIQYTPEEIRAVLVQDDRLAPKDYVFALRGQEDKAWPLDAFEGGQVINDAELDVVLVGDAATRSASFSVAMASSLSIHRKSFSSREIFSISAFIASSCISFCSSSPSVSSNSASREGDMVRRSQPASSIISSVFLKLAPMTSVW